eukprot:4821117-Karenia_brevis.AAC.1
MTCAIPHELAHPCGTPDRTGPSTLPCQLDETSVCNSKKACRPTCLQPPVSAYSLAKYIESHAAIFPPLRPKAEIDIQL